MKTLIKIAVCWVLVGVFQCSPSNGQPNTVFNADEICREALGLSLDEGVALLEDNIDRCEDDANVSSCRFKMSFTAGYLYQLAASKSPDDQKSGWIKSLEYYLRAYEIDPTDIAVLNNMFMVSQALGNWQAALNILDRAIAADQRNRDKYLINKGDVFYEHREFEKAVESYRSAFFANLNNEALAWRIFNSYAQLPVQSKAYEGLFSFSNELLDRGLDDLARNGFLFAVKNSLPVGNDEKAVESCVRWAESLSMKKEITGNYIDELPSVKTWPSVCNQELQMLLTNSFQSVGQLPWWTGNDYYRHIGASLLLKMESGSLLEGKVQNAVHLVETALKIAPEFFAYDSPKLSHYYPVKMDIAIELSRLYNRYPDLDLDKSKYDRLIRDLFNEKAAHYLQNDVGAIQKSHTMLGLIFADRGVWTSDWYAGNAIFQLDHAIQFQKRIEAEDPGKFKPIPSIYHLLGKGYEKTNETRLATRTWIDAAAGYLDLDNLSMADSIIRKLDNDQPLDDDYSKKLKEIRLISSMRFKIRNGSYDFKNRDIANLEKEITESELFKMNSYKNDQSFINRQKFKILADMGSKCTELNPAYQYPFFEVQALNYIGQEKALSNYRDIDRLSLIETKFKKNLEQEDVGVRVNQYNDVIEDDGRSKIWQLNSGSYQGKVQVNNDLFIAGKVYEDITNATNDKNVDSLGRIQIRSGEVNIPSDLQEKEVVDENEIRRIKGVTNVRIIKTGVEK